MAQFVVSLITIAVVANVMLLGVAYGSLLERKVASWVQDRIGPNRTGFSFGLPFMPTFHFWGLGQPLADGIKFLFKEDYTPAHVDRILFFMAPVLTVVPAFLGWIVIPWGGQLQWGDQVLSITGAPLDIGIIYILAISSIAVYGVVLAGFSSNNKYSFLGGLRAAAQMLSYEIPLGICALTIILISGTPRADLIVQLQTGHSGGIWNLWPMWLVALIFITCNLAETNRLPFDLAEAEQELVGGYHTEFNSMKFALFMMGEYLHLMTTCGFFTLMFLGGWSISPFGLWPDLPVVGGIGIVLAKFAVFGLKVFGLVFLVMVVRWTLPRFRFDQLMRLAWRGLIPAALGLLLATGGIVYAVVVGSLTWGQARWCLLGANAVVAAAALVIALLLPHRPIENQPIAVLDSRFNAPAPAPVTV